MLHARERARGHRRPEPARTRGRPLALVPDRHRRQPGRQVGPAPLPRAPDVQGHGADPARRVLEDRGPPRRQRQRHDELRLHRLLPDDRQGPAAARHGDGGRPHGQPPPQRRRGLPRARRHPRGAAPARRQRAGLDPGRGAGGRAVAAPPLPPAGDRLDARDRVLHPRGLRALLRDLVRAQQRGPDRGRRRRRGRAAAAGRGGLRRHPGPARAGAHARRTSRRSTPSGS